MTETERSKTSMMGRDAAAAVVYRDLKDSQRATFQVAAEWGRWLIASLVLVHSGALFGMFSLLNNAATQPTTLQAFKAPVWCFVVGLLLAFASGFFAWINWSMHSFNYASQARYDMLWDSEKWVDPPHYARGLDITNWGSIVSGLLSALCIAVGAALILHGDYLAAIFGI
ncbi:hypothetical protein [Mesorhizobium kowhaii]|uniref:Uncharacterized protein n=1 Tax=Mesorhizobium kowhaii TaxID=1300272 RepID=A0A2W7CQ65_9HYPH|nr:hypothetical protein [Mesorhizobium kowhaii]PZV35989.1 hypothetical protein B5V02_22410 [Mesorhizobium kowhaii]